MNGYNQLSLDLGPLSAALDRMDGHAAQAEQSLQAQGQILAAMLREVRREGFPVREAPSKRAQAQESGNTCPLCRGHLNDDVCDRCGMQVSL